jgi:hypothetical protein
LKGSTSSPVSRRFAIAFTVKSRRAHVVLDRKRGVGDDHEVMSARAGAALRARRRELDPGGRRGAHLLVARIQPSTDLPARNLEVLHLAVRIERAAKSVVVDARNDEIRVLRVEPEQLVANGPADEVRVEPETADEVLDYLVHGCPAR